MAEDYGKRPIHSLRFEAYRQFDTTGARDDYQDEYFEHRKRMNVMGMCRYLFGGETYLREAENIIWAVCDEYTWCLPAHLGGRSLEIIENSENAGSVREKDGLIQPYDYSHRNKLDLFACETVKELAELLRLIGNDLAPAIRHRAVTEVIDRVFNRYLTFNQIHHFEADLSNWSAVCGGSLGVASIYLIDSNELLAPVIQRAISDLDVFLSSYGADGIGREGIGYWNYGFSNFCYFADLLKERTNGAIDLFQDEKVKKVAFFPTEAFLFRDCCVNFSDCESRRACSEEILAYLMQVYPDMPAATALSVPSPVSVDRMKEGPVTLREIFWRTEKKGEEFRERSDYFPDAGWMVSCVKQGSTAFSFVIKGGNNAEPHNHNDLGHFILSADGEQLLCDLGIGLYTKDYFGAGRYGYLVNSSRGHSVPLIEGTPQKAGKDAYAQVISVRTGRSGREEAEDEIVLDLTRAYPVPELDGLIRTATVKKGRFSAAIRDVYAFHGENLKVTEQFVSLIKPEIRGGEAVVAGSALAVKISCEKDGAFSAAPQIKEEVFEGHDGSARTAYLIRYEFCLEKSGDEVLFRIEPSEK